MIKLDVIKNRRDAGKKLGEKLEQIIKNEALILAIPRGGVVVGYEISKILRCPLDVIISKKITPPSSPEFAVGAVTHDGTIYQSRNWYRYSQEPGFIEEQDKKRLEVNRRLKEYRGSVDYKVNNKTVILVDDGIATGATVFVLLKWLSNQNVKRIILAVPVIPANTYEELKPFVERIVSLQIPTEFYAVGQFYQEFDQVSDEEVKEILNKSKNPTDYP